MKTNHPRPEYELGRSVDRFITEKFRLTPLGAFDIEPSELESILATTAEGYDKRARFTMRGIGFTALKQPEAPDVIQVSAYQRLTKAFETVPDDIEDLVGPKKARHLQRSLARSAALLIHHNEVHYELTRPSQSGIIAVRRTSRVNVYNPDTYTTSPDEYANTSISEVSAADEYTDRPTGLAAARSISMSDSEVARQFQQMVSAGWLGEDIRITPYEDTAAGIYSIMRQLRSGKVDGARSPSQR